MTKFFLFILFPQDADDIMTGHACRFVDYEYSIHKNHLIYSKQEIFSVQICLSFDSLKSFCIIKAMKLQKVLRAIRNADQDFGLIAPKDKIAVALSGGKDSMLLFLALAQYQKFPHTDFELVGIHIDVGFEDFDHALLKEFAQKHDLNLHIEKTRIFDILKLEKNLSSKGTIQCSLCSTLKKGTLFDVAKKLGCNKIAFGHHGDDAIETLFLNMAYGSKIATFQPDQYMSRMDMHLIRPMIYMKEKEIEAICAENDIPAVKRVCPNDGFTQRQEFKELLNQFYEKYPFAQDNFLTSLSNDEQISLWKKKER